MFLASFNNENPTEEEKMIVLEAWNSVECDKTRNQEIQIGYVYTTKSVKRIIAEEGEKYIIQNIQFTNED